MLLNKIKKQLEFRRSYQLSRSEFEAFKLKKFRKLVQYANQHSPYYARVIQEHNISIESCLPEDFPVIDKAAVMENFDDIITTRDVSKRRITEFLKQSTSPTDLLDNKYHVIHTSGSSGEPGYFIFSKADWVNGSAPNPRASLRKFVKRKQKRFQRPRLAYYAATDGHYAGVSLVSSMTKNLMGFLINVGIYNINSPLKNIVKQLNEFQPSILAGYATAIKILAEQQRAGILQINPSIVVTSGEPLSLADREFITQTFQCPLGNSYASSEHLTMGYSNKDGSIITLYDDDLIFEFYSDHTVISNLFNFTLPLIRYKMSDALTPLPDDYSNSPYINIKSIVGRTEITPYFINENGERDFISPITIVELFIPGASRFQMQLVSEKSFIFKLCLQALPHGEKHTEAQQQDIILASKKRLEEILALKEMSNIDFEVVVVSDLKVNSKTGKFQLIVPHQS